MANESDPQIASLEKALSSFYGLLVTVCSKLPLPINLPDMPVTDMIVVQAVKRMTRIIEDETISHRLAHAIFTGALHWLTAARLLDVLRSDWDRTPPEDRQYLPVTEIQQSLALAGEFLTLAAQETRKLT